MIVSEDFGDIGALGRHHVFMFIKHMLFILLYLYDLHFHLQVFRSIAQKLELKGVNFYPIVPPI